MFRIISRLAASLKAVVKAFEALFASSSLMRICPVHLPGVRTQSGRSGAWARPRSHPPRGPVLVTGRAASTAKLSARRGLAPCGPNGAGAGRNVHTGLPASALPGASRNG